MSWHALAEGNFRLWPAAYPITTARDRYLPVLIGAIIAAYVIGLFYRQGGGDSMMIEGVIVDFVGRWWCVNHGPSMVDARLIFRRSANIRPTKKGTNQKQNKSRISFAGKCSQAKGWKLPVRWTVVLMRRTTPVTDIVIRLILNPYFLNWHTLVTIKIFFCSPNHQHMTRQFRLLDSSSFDWYMIYLHKYVFSWHIFLFPSQKCPSRDEIMKGWKCKN